MDSANLSAARVYESLGYEKVSDNVWFELRLGN
jgi:predicted GNAT family acetyltransferase